MSEIIIRKTYLCSIVGQGTFNDRRRPKIADLPIDCSWFMHELVSNLCLATVVAKAGDHDIIALDPEVELILNRKEIVVSSTRLADLEALYPNWDRELAALNSSRVKLSGETGE